MRLFAVTLTSLIVLQAVAARKARSASGLLGKSKAVGNQDDTLPKNTAAADVASLNEKVAQQLQQRLPPGVLAAGYIPDNEWGDEDLGPSYDSVEDPFGLNGGDYGPEGEYDEKEKHDEYYPPKKEEYYEPKKEEYYEPKKDEYYPPKKEEHYEHKKEEYYEPKKEEYYEPKKDEYYPPKKEEHYEHKKEEYYEPKKEEYHKPKKDEYEDKYGDDYKPKHGYEDKYGDDYKPKPHKDEYDEHYSPEKHEEYYEEGPSSYHEKKDDEYKDSYYGEEPEYYSKEEQYEDYPDGYGVPKDCNKPGPFARPTIEKIEFARKDKIIAVHGHCLKNIKSPMLLSFLNREYDATNREWYTDPDEAENKGRFHCYGEDEYELRNPYDATSVVLRQTQELIVFSVQYEERGRFCKRRSWDSYARSYGPKDVDLHGRYLSLCSADSFLNEYDESVEHHGPDSYKDSHSYSRRTQVAAESQPRYHCTDCLSCNSKLFSYPDRVHKSYVGLDKAREANAPVVDPIADAVHKQEESM